MRGLPATEAKIPVMGASSVNPGKMNKNGNPILQTYLIGFIIWITKIALSTNSNDKINEYNINSALSLCVGGAPWNLNNIMNSE